MAYSVWPSLAPRECYIKSGEEDHDAAEVVLSVVEYRHDDLQLTITDDLVCSGAFDADNHSWSMSPCG